MQRRGIRGAWNSPAPDPQGFPTGQLLERDIRLGRLNTMGVPLIGATCAITGPLQLACGGDQTAANTLEQALQRPLDGAVAFTDNSTIETNDFPFYLQWPGVRKLVISQCLTEPGWDMAATAGGAHDAEYGLAVASLVPYKDRILAIRIGWEFNASGGYPWSIGGAGTNQTPANYAACFKRFARMFREQMPGVPIDWCPLWDHDLPDPWYPGDDVVDIIGNDVYLNSAFWSDSFFNPLFNTPACLTWQENFAEDHGKMLSFPEWATNYDTGTFIRRMAEWMNRPRQTKVAYQGYWNSNSNFQGAFSTHPGNYAAYKECFGEVL